MEATSTFLCVDDEPNVLTMEKMLLESVGFRVLTAASGADAIEIFQSENVDVVVMDYAMPGMNGLETARIMKMLKPAVPIVFLSAYAELPGESLGLAQWWAKKGEQDPEALIAGLRSLVERGGTDPKSATA